MGLLARRALAERPATRRRRKLDRAALDGEFSLDRPHGLLGRFAALGREVGALEQARIASAAAGRRRTGDSARVMGAEPSHRRPPAPDPAAR